MMPAKKYLIERSLKDEYLDEFRRNVFLRKKYLLASTGGPLLLGIPVAYLHSDSTFNVITKQGFFYKDIPFSELAYVCETEYLHEIAEADSCHVRYWIDVWDEICAIADSQYFTFDHNNPHILVRDLVSEIQFNSKDNEDNRKFFIDKLGHILREDLAANKHRTELSRIIAGLQKKEKKEYLLHLCQHVLQNVFLSGAYYRALCAEFKQHLLSAPKKFRQIYECSKSMIVELFLHGYSFSRIREIPNQILSLYQVWPTGYVHTAYPHGIQPDDYSDSPSYNQAIRKLMESLDLSQRLEKFVTYVKPSNNQSRERIYIFPVTGLRHHDKYQIGNVSFYCPMSHRFITKGLFDQEPPDDGEFFNRKPEDSEYDPEFGPVMNAAVAVKVSDAGREQQIAIAAIQRAFDVFRSRMASPAKLQVDADRCRCATLDGRADGGYDTARRAIDDVVYGYDLTSSDSLDPNWLLRASEIVNGKLDNDMKFRLALAVRWHRRATDSSMDEDKVLYNWIAIESVFASSNGEEAPIRSILRILPLTTIPDYIVSHGEDLISHIHNDRHFKKRHLPPNSLDKYGISFSWETGMMTYIRDKVIRNLPDLRPYAVSQRTQERFDSTYSFFTNPEAAASELKALVKSCEADIISVYRYRNRVVHNALINEDELRLVANKAHFLARRLLGIIFDYYVDCNAVDMQSALTRIEIKVRLFLEKLASKKVNSPQNYFDDPTTL